MSNRVLVGLQAGTKVLLDGFLHIAGEAVGDGRMYRDFKTGDERFLTGAQQLHMSLEFRLVLGELPGDLVDHIARARQSSFKVFSFADRTTALRRLRYVRAVHALPENWRPLKNRIQDCIDDVFGKLQSEDLSAPLAPDLPSDEGPTDEPPTLAEAVRDRLVERIARDTELDEAPPPSEKKAPTPRTVRRLYRLYYASGQDIRVLLPLHCLKGHRGDRYPKWIMESVEKVIDQSVLCPTPTTYAHALQLASDRVVKDAAGRKLPTISVERGGMRVLGKNLISRLVGRIDQFRMTNRQLGIGEARRRFSAVELGPQGDYANHQWEVDHTLLDVFVIDPLSRKAYARPWLTAIIDRYSRCIVGYSLSFAPPSWVSVMDALRVAIFRKDKLLKGLNAGGKGIDNNWECEGLPEFLITDHGREFKSRSMDQTLEMLSIKSFQTKKRKPWLKGKIERFFGTIEEFLHSIPGTTFSKFYQREFYQSEKFAVLTIQQLNWIVAKWIVDAYHQDDHSKIPYPPAEMWSRSVSTQRVVRRAPEEEFEPLMGVVVDRCLRRGGIKYLGLRYDSQGFARLRGRLPKDADVPVRIDPRDLEKAYVWDDSNDTWVVGHLKEPVEAAGYSLDQWFFIEFNRKENQKVHGMGRKAAIAKAISDINEFIDGIRGNYQNSKAYKRYLEFTTQGASAWQTVAQPDFDPDEDGPMKPHRPGATEVRSRLAETGPYRDDNPPSAAEPRAEQSLHGDQAEERAGEVAQAPPIAPETPVKPKRAPRRKPETAAAAAKPAAEGAQPGKPVADDDEYVDDDFSGPVAVRSQSSDK